MKLEELTEKIKMACPEVLKSIVLYGSAAAGDHTGKRSDYNVLVVLDKLGMAELDALMPVSVEWAGAGNRPPLLFTSEGIRKSVDSFAIELADMKDAHRVLFGEDLLADIAIQRDRLRAELERDLRTRLIQLRERYVLTGGKSKDVMELMVRSLSAFLVLFRAALRLYQADAPRSKLDALDSLSRFISFDKEPFVRLHDLKTGDKLAKGTDVKDLFGRYIANIEIVLSKIDSFKTKE